MIVSVEINWTLVRVGRICPQRYPWKPVFVSLCWQIITPTDSIFYYKLRLFFDWFFEFFFSTLYSTYVPWNFLRLYKDSWIFRYEYIVTRVRVFSGLLLDLRVETDCNSETCPSFSSSSQHLRTDLQLPYGVVCVSRGTVSGLLNVQNP